MAASVTLQWDPNDPTPDGYRVFARTSAGSYDYANPDWEGTAVTCTLDNLADATDYYFVVRAYAGSLESADSAEVHYAPAASATNQAPSAAADAYAVAEGGTLSVAAASGVLANDSDPEGDALSAVVYTAPVNGTLSLSSNGGFTYTHNGSETTSDSFTYRLADGNGNTDTASVAITITAVNDSPRANAGSDQSASEGDAVTLDGSASWDPDSSSLSYLWVQTSGPTASLSSANAVRPSFTAPEVDTAGGVVIFQLTVTDGSGGSSTDTCRVSISDTTATDPTTPSTTDTDGDGSPDSVDKDDDNDGMPDAWELFFGLDPTVNDADLDLDGDGISNRDEYRADLEPDSPGVGAAPNQAVAVSPTGDTNVTCSPTLSAQAYADSDGDAHIATQWQIYAVDSGDCLLDVISDRRLTSLKVPLMLLDGESSYQWRLRYFDSGGKASPWSTLATFTTAAVNNDQNGNGIPDDEESGVLGGSVSVHAISTAAADITPTDIDADSVETTVTVGQAALLDPVDFDTDATTPDVLPGAVVAYKLNLGVSGAQAQVTVQLSSAAPADAVWLKYDAIDGWQDFSAQSAFSADRQSVTMTIRDGGIGDADGVANGIILDPAGLSTAAVDSSTGTSTSADGGGGGGGGCFITSAGAPGMPSTFFTKAWQWVRTTVRQILK